MWVASGQRPLYTASWRHLPPPPGGPRVPGGRSHASCLWTQTALSTYLLEELVTTVKAGELLDPLPRCSLDALVHSCCYISQRHAHPPLFLKRIASMCYMAGQISKCIRQFTECVAVQHERTKVVQGFAFASPHQRRLSGPVAGSHLKPFSTSATCRADESRRGGSALQAVAALSAHRMHLVPAPTLHL